jgi:hypothetical protein
MAEYASRCKSNKLLVVCQFPPSANRREGYIAATNHRTGFLAENAGKIISCECKFALHCRFFAAEALRILISNIFWLQPLKSLFAI